MRRYNNLSKDERNKLKEIYKQEYEVFKKEYKPDEMFNKKNHVPFAEPYQIWWKENKKEVNKLYEEEVIKLYKKNQENFKVIDYYKIFPKFPFVKKLFNNFDEEFKKKYILEYKKLKLNYYNEKFCKNNNINNDNTVLEEKEDSDFDEKN
jgi:hypothetical protein